MLAKKSCSSFLGRSKHVFLVPSALYMDTLLSALLRITKCPTEQDCRNSEGGEHDDGQAHTVQESGESYSCSTVHQYHMGPCVYGPQIVCKL